MRILNLEDNPNDAELIQTKLEEEGLRCEVTRVETEKDFVAALERDGFDIILADYKLPSYDGLSALAIAKDKYPDIPFILISGTIGEESAVEAMKRGANDYLLKDRLTRLAPSVRRALKEAKEISERKLAEERLKELNACFLEFGPEPLENINRLVSLCGKFMSGTCALYNRLEDGRLCSWGQWNVPPDYNPVDAPDGHICFDVIKDASDAVVVIRNLAETSYARTDPNVTRYNLQTYVGIAVKFSGSYIGSLCVVYQRDFSPSEDERKIMGIIASAIGVEEERKRAENLLIALSNKISMILNCAGEGIYGLNPDGNVTFINPAAARMLGYEVEELVGKHSHSTWHHAKPDGTSFPVEECKLYVALKEGMPSAAENSVFWKKDGTSFPIEYISAPIFEGDSPVGAVVTFNDITNRMEEEKERKKINGQLLQAQKMEAIGTLTGGIAHDFNNILNVIIGYGTMALDRQGDDDLSKEQINEVLAAADRAANLTKRLLAFSRKQALDIGRVNVNEIILGLKKMLARIIGEDIAFPVELTDRELNIMADLGQIEQVLMNLVTNARDAMPKGGTLTISTGTREIDEGYIAAYGYGKAGNYALISVTDTGAGMVEEIQKQIFEPFFTTKEIGKGTGLGLAVSYGIIKQHDGYIKVYSEPGNGTTFTILLPLVEETTAKVSEAGAVAPIKSGTETILVVEDDPSLRKLERIILESFGYTVITAENGEDAITKFMENRDRIQLVILDLIMPKKSGKEAADEIRKHSPDIKILFMSGYTADIINKHEIQEGMEFIHKPVSQRDLLRKVRELLDR